MVNLMDGALCIVCNIWNITQVEAKCCMMSAMVSFECMGLFDILLLQG